MYCKVILPIPYDKEYTYRYPKKLSLEKGHVVLVPFGNRQEEIGVVSKIMTTVDKSESNIKFKEVIRIVNKIKLKSTILEFLQWVAHYTLNPMGLVLKMTLPNKKIIDYISDKKDILYVEENTKRVILNQEQSKAFSQINKFLKSKQKTIVLEGVTGSGKTEVYFEAVENILKLNLQVLILLPEISLTPQIENSFLKRFGFEPDVWHSKISLSKKRKIWNDCYRGFSKIIIGARSSLFIPFKNLGLIIIDEEHDISYKQEEGIRYQARDMAIVRSVFEKIPIILSTATPAIETYYNLKNKKYDHVFLSKQYSGFDLPSINLVDMKKSKYSNNWISEEIIHEIKNCLQNNKQSLLFLNKRGYAPLTICSSCGYRLQCDNCASWLVLHHKKKILSCHHCGFNVSIDKGCSNCNDKNNLKYIGPGVERVGEELNCIFPQAKIQIMSSDTMNTSKKINEIIKNVEDKKIDILVGTQILAKGYHFPSLSLVGVLDADAGLMGGDLRASEHTYNLLQQVSGRAGRTKSVGKVYIQTYFTDNPLIKSLKNRNRESFLNNILLERKNFNLPPYSFLISIIISGPTKSELLNYAKKLINKNPIKKGISVLGPVEAPIFLLRGKYRYRFLLKGTKRQELNTFTKKLIKNIVTPRNMRLTIDVDPYSFT